MIRRPLRVFVLFCLATSSSCGGGEPTSACGGTEVRLVSSGRLTIAADYSYPPFAYRSPDNELIGFDVDVAKAVAKDLKLEPTFVNRGSGALVTGLIAHRHDVAVSGLRVDRTLREEACPSAPYLDASLGVLVWQTNPHGIDSVEDLRNRIVAVLDDSDAEDWALEHLTSSSIQAKPTSDDLLDGLRIGEIDAVVADMPLVRFSAKRSPSFHFAARIGTGERFVLVGAKDNGPLVTGLNASLRRLKKNGTLAELEEKWFGDPISPSPSG